MSNCVERVTVEGIVHRFRTGCPWCGVPTDRGARQTICRCLPTWTEDGTFDTTRDPRGVEVHHPQEAGVR
ncbi:transposase [Kineococcus sp. GCM10028916]|uniref:transposase n=1 Tax=Kineococcus sp. GCM10028916 TaxID=3273394 RepID=UPI003624D799